MSLLGEAEEMCGVLVFESVGRGERIFRDRHQALVSTTKPTL